MNRQILELAIPNILSNLSVPILSSVDTGLAGHMPGPAYLAAIGLGTILFNYLYWSFGFLRMGTTGMTAQAYGRRDFAAANGVFRRGMLVALLVGGTFILLQWPIDWLAFRLFKAEPEVEALAAHYFGVRIFAAPATIGLYVLNGWFLGMQNARWPMALMILTNALNVGFTLLFVHFFDAGLRGIALGTVLAQYLGLGVGFLILLKNYARVIRYPLKKPLLHRGELRSFFSVNLNIFLRTIGLLTIFALFTGKSAELGTLVLGGNLVLNQLVSISAYGIDGFAFAAESLVGKFAGRQDRVNVGRAIRLALLWGLGIGLLFVLVFALFRLPLAQLFSDDIYVVLVAIEYLPWMLLYVGCAAFAFIWDGVFVGLTAGKAMRNSMLIALFGVFLPAYFLLIPWLGNTGLWLAMLLSVLGRGIPQSLMAPGVIRKAIA